MASAVTAPGGNLQAHSNDSVRERLQIVQWLLQREVLVLLQTYVNGRTLRNALWVIVFFESFAMSCGLFCFARFAMSSFCPSKL